LVVAGLFQKPGRDIELATAGIGGIDLWILQEGHAHLIRLEWICTPSIIYAPFRVLFLMQGFSVRPDRGTLTLICPSLAGVLQGIFSVDQLGGWVTHTTINP